MLSSHDFDEIDNQIDQLAFNLKEIINDIESNEDKKNELAIFHQKAQELLGKDLSIEAAKELFSIISLSFSANIKISLTYLDQYYSKSKSSTNFILVTSYILFDIVKTETQLSDEYYIFINEALSEILPQIQNKNQNWTLFKHEILPQFQDELLINLLFSSKMTEKIFNDFFRFILLCNLQCPNIKFRHLVDKILKDKNIIKYSPLSKKSNDEILEFITNQDFEIINRISDETLIIFASAFILIDSYRFSNKETLNEDMILQFIAVIWTISKKKNCITRVPDMKKFIIQKIESLRPNCEPIFYESFKILIDNFVTPSSNQLMFFELDTDFLLKSIELYIKYDNFLNLDLVTFYRIITHLVVHGNDKLNSLDYEMKNYIFIKLASNFDEILDYPCFSFSYNGTFLFIDQEMVNKYLFSLQKSSDIIKLVFFIDRCYDKLNDDEFKIHDFLKPFLVELANEKKWKDFLIIAEFSNQLAPSKKIDLQLPKTIKYLVSKDCDIKDFSIEETIEIISMKNDVKLSDETFYNIFEQMMKDKEISNSYFDYLVNIIYKDEYTVTDFLAFTSKQFKSYPDDLIEAIKRNFYFNGEFLYRKYNSNLSACPISKFGISIIDKLFSLYDNNPLNYQVLLILKSIVSSFPFLFKDYFQKTIDTVLPTLNYISLPFKEIKMKNQHENYKTALCALSFLFSSLSAPFALDKFFEWLFGNILTLSDEQISCLMMILKFIFDDLLFLNSALVYVNKYNFINIVTKLLERDIQNETFRNFYRKQIYSFLKKFYDKLNDFDAQSVIQVEELQKIENPFNYYYNFIYASFPNFMKLGIISRFELKMIYMVSSFMKNIEDVQPYWLYGLYFLNDDEIDYDFIESQEESFTKLLDEIKLPEISEYSIKDQSDFITIKIYRYFCMNRTFIFDWSFNDKSMSIVSPLLDELKKVEQITNQMENDCKEHPEDKDNELISTIDVDKEISSYYSRTLFTNIFNQMIELKIGNSHKLPKIQKIICTKKQGSILFFEILSHYLSQIDKNEAFQMKEKLKFIIRILANLSTDISYFNSSFNNSKCADKLIDLTLYFDYNEIDDFNEDVAKLFLNFDKNCLPNKIVKLIKFMLCSGKYTSAFEIIIKLNKKLNKVQSILIENKIQKEIREELEKGNLSDYFMILLKYMEGFIENHTKAIISIVNKCPNDKKIKAIDHIIRYLSSKKKEEEENKESTFNYIKESFPEFWNLYENNIDSIIEMIEKDPSILNFYSSILESAKLIKFDVRYSYFREIMKKSIDMDSVLSFEINRNNILEDSYKLMGIEPSGIKSKIVIYFENEPVQDVGGGKREWFEILIKEIFSLENNLFVCSRKNKSYQPSPLSSSDSENLKHFYFAGQIVARALIEGLCISCHLSRSFYKQILHQEPQFEDLEDFDQELYKGLKWIIDNDVSSLDLIFAIENEQHQLIQLKENGDRIEVNNQNKKEYVDLYSNFILKKQIEKQINSFIDGFYSLIDLDVSKFFNYDELDLILFGMPKIDKNDFMKNVQFVEPYTKDTPVIKLFFNVIEKWNNEDLEKLLLFMTGSSRIPVNGFNEFCSLTGSKLTIQPGGDRYLLPQAHICFNILCLPQYETEEEMNHKLHQAIQLCNTFEMK